mmetsp:Transcript_51331/g.164356  ORF Transcript_51331/g.164356 Transcript_51331/m.164356 type:complete len:337 (-) Transcript_51331:339-1349(-)
MEGAEAHSLAVHQEVKGLAAAGTVAVAGPSTTPYTGLSVDPKAVRLRYPLAVTAAEAGAHVRYHVAASCVRLQAADVCRRRPLRDPMRDQWRTRKHGHVAWHEARIAVQRCGSWSVVLAGCEAVGELRVEREEGRGLAVHGQVEGLAKVGVCGVARDAAAPHARLSIDLPAEERGVWPAITAAKARRGICQGAAPRRSRREAREVVLGKLSAFRAAGDAEAGLGEKGGEALALPVHEEVERLAEAAAVAVAQASAAPDAGLATNLEAPPLPHGAAVAAAQAGLPVLDHVAAEPVVHEARHLRIGGLLGDPPARVQRRHRWERDRSRRRHEARDAVR